LEIEQILNTSPQHLSLEEFYILAQTYEPGSDNFNKLFETAVRMYPNDPVANLNAANSAILKGDYRSALRYLDKAGDMPEAVYTRGALEVYMGNDDAAKAYFVKALELGVAEAEVALAEVAKNRNVVTKNNNKQ
jgi:tetratricopeptide (TPR) repeat protein